MVPERLGRGWVLAGVIDAVIHLFRRIVCRWIHHGLERKWVGGDVREKWERGEGSACESLDLLSSNVHPTDIAGSTLS